MLSYINVPLAFSDCKSSPTSTASPSVPLPSSPRPSPGSVGTAWAWGLAAGIALISDVHDLLVSGS